MGRLNVARGKRFRRPLLHRSAPEVAIPPAPPANTTPPAATTLRGWDDIAAALDVHPKTAQDYAARHVDPLPVFYDHASRPCIRVSALSAWIDRQALFFRTYHVLRAAGKLPGHVRVASKQKKRRDPTKVAKRSAA